MSAAVHHDARVFPEAMGPREARNFVETATTRALVEIIVHRSGTNLLWVSAVYELGRRAK